jgi:hypothetical protein
MSKELLPEPTERKYKIKGKVKFYRKNVVDHGRRYERVLAIIIPETSTEQMMFFNAWLPDTKEEYHELTGLIGSPVNSACKLSIHRGPDEKSEKHYLFVMSKGVEEELIKYEQEGKTLELTILPESEEMVGDEAKDSSGDFDLISGQENFQGQ